MPTASLIERSRAFGQYANGLCRSPQKNLTVPTTESAESQASDRTIMSIAGHVSQQMLAHYSHVRVEAKRKAQDALAIGVKAEGYDTNHDTKQSEAAILSSQALEKNGGDDGTRTRGLCRDRAAF